MKITLALVIAAAIIAAVAANAAPVRATVGQQSAVIAARGIVNEAAELGVNAGSALKSTDEATLELVKTPGTPEGAATETLLSPSSKKRKLPISTEGEGLETLARSPRRQVKARRSSIQPDSSRRDTDKVSMPPPRSPRATSASLLKKVTSGKKRSREQAEEVLTQAEEVVTQADIYSALKGWPHNAGALMNAGKGKLYLEVEKIARQAKNGGRKWFGPASGHIMHLPPEAQARIHSKMDELRPALIEDITKVLLSTENKRFRLEPSSPTSPRDGQ